MRAVIGSRCLVVAALLASGGVALFTLSSTAETVKKTPLSIVQDAKPANSEAAATIVVYNSEDPDSDDLARFYASQRGIAKDHVIGLRCPVKEEITRAEYDETIAEPLRKLFTKKDWWELRPADHPLGRVARNRIRFVALIRGMPLKVSATFAYPGDQIIGPPVVSAHNEVAVDSELAILGSFTPIISGTRDNKYFRSYSRIHEAGLPEMLLVTRLDAPTPAIVKRMITDSIAAEREGLRGFAYIDARSVPDPGLKEGDKWLFGAAAEARKRGMPVILDNGEGMFPEAYPLRDAALYFGWYTANMSGPFLRPDFRFPRGAVAVHIHSFSAATLHDPRAGWCGPLVAAGAAATVGNVYEPYLGLTPQIDIFHDRLQNGFTFAESAWMSVRATSWQTTMVGDPLYRPFKFNNDLAAKPGRSEWDVYREGARLWYGKDRASGEAALRAAAKRLRSGLIWEGFGLLELTTSNGQEQALEAFSEARRAYTSPDDAVRATIHQAILLKAMKRDSDALALIKQTLAAFPKTNSAQVLQMLDPAAVPAAPPAPAAQPASAAAAKRR